MAVTQGEVQDEAGETSTVRGERGQLFAVVCTLAVSLVAVLLLPLVDTDRVTEPAERASNELGLPLAWIEQDQSARDAPLPSNSGLASPWENPTDVSVGALLANVALTALALAVLLAMLAALLATVRSQRRR